MKNNTRWIIVDTETDGLFAPIHIVEIAAQAMVGWEPEGTPFQVFLNHDIRIPYEATAVHGYTRDFLAENGTDPLAADSSAAASSRVLSSPSRPVTTGGVPSRTDSTKW